MSYIDLHVHTNCSDGTMSPTEVVNHAVELKLSAIAITDHDTVAGVAEAKAAALPYADSNQSITILPGVEISAEYKGRDIHILGINVDETNDVLVQTLECAQKERDQRNEKMAANLRADGIEIQVSDLTFDEPDTVITRAHFARYLIQKGYAKDNADAFARYLATDTKYYVPRSYMTPEHAIQIIKTAGGVPVLAHPLLYKLTLEEIDVLVAFLKSLGLEGIETIYSANTGFDEGIVRRYVNKYDLIMTGGSDFHGKNKPKIELGIGLGNLKIPDTLLQPIYEHSKNK